MATRSASGDEVIRGADISVQKYTLSNSYTTGGEAVTEPRLRRIAAATCAILTPGGGVINATYDRTTGKLKCFTAAAEVANATDLSAVVVEVTFQGVI